MITPLLNLFISIILIVILIVLGVNAGYALIFSAILFGVLTFPINKLGLLLANSLLSYSAIKLLTIFILTFYLAAYLYNAGLLNKITDSLTNFNFGFAALVIPSIVGLIPMPGGALVSAMMAKNLYLKKLSLKSDYATYINYWFRHVWLAIWPIYQSLIIASYILHMDIWELIGILYPASISTIMTGILFAYPIIKSSGEWGKLDIKNFFKGIWPFLMIIILAVLLRIDLLITLISTVFAIKLIYNFDKKNIINSLKFALSPKLLFLIIAVVMFKYLISNSTAPNQLISFLMSYKVPDQIISFLIPFSLSTVSASEYVSVALAFPILIDIFLKNGTSSINIFFAFLGSYMGVYLSPIHLCLVLSSEYFGTKIYRVYKFIVPSILLSILISILIIYIINF